MKQHIYVIGSNSFSGAFFIRHALEQGYAVTGVSRSPEPDPVFLPYAWPGVDKSRFVFLRADLNTDLDEIMRAMQRDEPGYVVNFAAQGMVAESWRHPEQWLRTNTVSQVRLHDRLRSCRWLKKYVQISTPEVYGSTAGILPESTVYTPSTPYAVSKAAADMSLMTFLRAYDFPVVFTRAANVYGPGQQLYRIIPRAALRFLTGGVLELHGGGHSVRSFIHMRDVAGATLRVMEEAEPGSIYHVATRSSVSIRELSLLVAQEAGVDPEKHIVSVGERLGKDAAYLLDTTKIRSELGWEDMIPLEEGIREVVSWVRDNLEVLKRQQQDYIHKE